MNNGAKLGAGVAGGYLLGRTKKLKLAVGLGAWLLGKKLDLSPSQLAMQGFGQLKQTPEFAELSDRLRSEVGGAGKKALAAAATSRMDSIADRLQDRNEGVYDDEDVDEDEPEDELDEDDEPRGQDDADEDYDDGGVDHGARPEERRCARQRPRHRGEEPRSRAVVRRGRDIRPRPCHRPRRVLG